MSTTYQNQILLTDIIAPSFYSVHWDIAEGKHTYYDLYGGRGSTKSSFISVEIVLGIMQDPLANAIVFRKYGVTLRESVFEQVEWAIDSLGVSDLWAGYTNPMRFVYKPTGQKIIFRGLDKAKKTKSIKVSHGYFKYLWFEELDEFAGMEEIRTVQQSVLRGGEKFIVFKSFNPPITNANWANQYVNEPRESALRHKSDYTTVTPEWLGQQFFDDAEHLKETNPKAYEHEYLGIPVGLGTNIFEFLEIREITDEEIARMDRLYSGVDWGFYPDAYHFILDYYNPKEEKIYLIDENRRYKTSNKDTAKWILDNHSKHLHAMPYGVICDSAEPKSVADYKDLGVWNARAAHKPPGSVEYGMKWLQSRTIVIDPKRTPYALKEITEYEYERDPDGNVMSGYPDHDNHAIDSLRYSLSPVFMRRMTQA